jgi:hypothetical protein
MAKPKAVTKVPISERALFQRINRRLKKDGRALQTARGFSDGTYWHENTNLGRYYIVDVRRNFVVNHHLDLQELGRELEVLSPWEELVEA